MSQFYSLWVPHNLRWWQRFRQRPNSINRHWTHRPDNDLENYDSEKFSRITRPWTLPSNSSTRQRAWKLRKREVLLRLYFLTGSALLEEGYDSDSSLNIGIEFINDLETWEENWLFQKKKGRPHTARSVVHHPVPVPMLVPCPGPDQTCRTLIGKIQDVNVLFSFYFLSKT